MALFVLTDGPGVFPAGQDVSASDDIQGRGGDDVLAHVAPTSTVDRVVAGAAPQKVVAFAARQLIRPFTTVQKIADVMLGGEGDDTLDGGEGNDVLSGGNGVARLKGRGGDDVLAGGPGLDVIHGGEGYDTASFAEESAGVVIGFPSEGEEDADYLSIEAFWRFRRA